LAELEERGVGLILGYRPSSCEEFLLAPIHPPLVTLTGPSVEFVSLGDHSRRMFDDGAGMHEYLSCTGIVVVPASDPKDLFVECVTI
jgi:hypothetical protein